MSQTNIERFEQLLRETNRDGIENLIAFIRKSDFYTAPASITGLPAIVFGGVQLIGAPLSDASLVALAKTWEKEGK